MGNKESTWSGLISVNHQTSLVRRSGFEGRVPVYSVCSAPPRTALWSVATYSSTVLGKCKTWTLDWTGLVDWTDGLEFGLTNTPLFAFLI